MERKALVNEVRQACMAAIQTHLESFLQENPQGLYQDWIAELHPDNVIDNTIDARFYIQESDHRILWNQYHDHDLDSSVRSVPASSMSFAAAAAADPQTDDTVDIEEKMPALSFNQQQGEHKNLQLLGDGDDDEQQPLSSSRPKK